MTGETDFRSCRAFFQQDRAAALFAISLPVNVQCEL
jgi:hypothetical protein